MLRVSLNQSVDLLVEEPEKKKGRRKEKPEKDLREKLHDSWNGMVGFSCIHGLLREFGHGDTQQHHSTSEHNLAFWGNFEVVQEWHGESQLHPFNGCVHRLQSCMEERPCHLF